MNNPLNILSLGAGVQSTTVLLMVELGELEPIQTAIFADTGWEPKAVYDHLAWLESYCKTPIVRVSAGNIREDTMAGQLRGKRWVSMPFFTSQGGIVRRQCTKDYKIRPIRREIRRLLNKTHPQPGEVDLWFGISLDEVRRMRMSDTRYISYYYPLIERGMTRNACLQWLEAKGFPRPPRSACLGCPYHSDSEWRKISQNPDEWRDVIEFDTAIRRKVGMRGDLFLHHSALPLEIADLSTAEERGQENMFDNECAGICGV